MGGFQRKRLGDILIDAGVIAPEQLTEALSRQKETGARLGQVLIYYKYVTGEQIAAALSAQLGIPYVRLADYNVDEELIKLIPDKVARKHKILPIEKTDEKITVAVADPLDITILDSMSLMLGQYIEPVIAPENEIVALQDQLYASLDTLENAISSMGDEDGIMIEDSDTPGSNLSAGGEAAAAETPVIKYVNAVIVQALKDRASDIHIEPFEKTMQIRERIDGVLQSVPAPPRNLWSGIPSRIKVMANLNIAEVRMPQDGRIRLKLGKSEVDMRVSTMPTMYGESVVLRLLDRSAMILKIDQLGFQKPVEEKFLKQLQNPNGVLLITGPTGCGKTSTLYAGILEINSTDDKIITVEDPVEYEVNGLVQCQVNEKIGMTFAAALRSILRQDPDIILVGEIRDVETAEIAVQSALTGHLVLSTTHTNDAAGAVTRLIDMGVEPFLLTSTVRGICAQRLVRTICPECREQYTPDPETLRKLGATPEMTEGVTFIHGKGCPHCVKTGYRGRIGIYELLEMTDEVMDLVVNKQPANIIHRKAVEQGMQSMAEDGWQKVCAGITTAEEVLRVAPTSGLTPPAPKSVAIMPGLAAAESAVPVPATVGGGE